MCEVFFDFDKYQTSLKRYGGSDKKISVHINNDIYMIKFNDKISSDKRNELNSSYRNSAVSEYISCHICESLGLSVQETLLGVRTDKGEKKIVVACKDFCTNGFELNEFEKYQNSSDINSKSNKYPDLYKVIETINEENDINKIGAEQQFWEIFVVDAFLGNFDRHTGNWGYLYNKYNYSIKLAPIYDCGACLYPMISDEGIKKIIDSEDEINERIYGFPKSAFSENGIRISYYDFLQNTEDKNCLDALSKIYTMIDFEIINDIIDNTPFISEIRKTFYKTILKARYDKILKPTYERFLTIANTKNNSIKNVQSEMTIKPKRR